VRRFCFERIVDFRIMDVKSMLFPVETNSEVGSRKGAVIGFAACSDGILRIVRENGNFKFSRTYLKATGSQHCLTTVQLVQRESSSVNTVNVLSGTSAGEILMWTINLSLQDKNTEDSWMRNNTEISPNRVFKVGLMPITALDCVQTHGKVTVLVGGDDGSIHRIVTNSSLNPEMDVLLQMNVTNDGILGFRYHHPREGATWDDLSVKKVNIHFVSGGKLYKSDINLENITCLRIPIQDGKGITICNPIAFCDTFYRPIVTFGKGMAVFTLK